MANKRILVVDDDPDEVSVLKAVLEQSGHTVETARDEKESLKKYNSFKPDIIFLDMMMENMDSGYRICTLIRENDRKTIIYMISSAGDDKAGTRDWHEIGFNDTFEKPLNPEYIKKLVE